MPFKFFFKELSGIFGRVFVPKQFNTRHSPDFSVGNSVIKSVVSVYHTADIEVFYYYLLPETVLSFNEKCEDPGLVF